MKPYANESEVVQIEGITIENRLDRISIHGEIDITRDKLGITTVKELKAIIDATLRQLEVEDAKGKLPDRMAVEKTVSVENPFI